MSNDTKLRTVITAILAVPARRLHAHTEMAKNLAGPDGEAWHSLLKSTLKAGTTTTWKLSAEMLNSSDHACMQKFYDTHFPKMEVIVPHFEDVEGKVGLYVAEGLTCDAVYVAWNFPKWKWTSSIDAQLDPVFEARKASNGSYLVYVLDGTEPDAKYLGKSVRQVDPEGKLGTTLLERMVHEQVYFDRTGKHLDVKGYTLCSGSRYRGGDVPDVYLDSFGVVCVDRYHVGFSDSGYGVRSVVLGSLAT
jgi:hypothetical protein